MGNITISYYIHTYRSKCYTVIQLEKVNKSSQSNCVRIYPDVGWASSLVYEIHKTNTVSPIKTDIKDLNERLTKAETEGFIWSEETTQDDNNPTFIKAQINKDDLTFIRTNFTPDNERVMDYVAVLDHSGVEINGFNATTDLNAGDLKLSKGYNSITLQPNGVSTFESNLRVEATPVDSLDVVRKTDLDAAISDEKQRAENVEGALSNRVGFVENLLPEDVKNVSPDVGPDSLEEPKILATTEYVNTKVTEEAKSRENTDTKLANNLSDEINRAKGIEANFETRISTMEVFWNSADNATEVVDTLKELQDYIASDESNAAAMLSSINSNAAAIKTEQERAEKTEKSLKVTIDNLYQNSEIDIKVEEINKLISIKEEELAAEVTARTDADTALGARVDDVISDLEETVETFEGEIKRVEGLISTEETDRINADTQLRTDFTNADTQIRTDFAEVDTAIRGEISSLKTELEGKISTEKSRAEAIEISLRADVDAIINKVGTPSVGETRTIYEIITDNDTLYRHLLDLNENAISTETERATGIEFGLDGRISALESAKDDYKAADATLKADLQKEIDENVKVVSDALTKAKTDISAEIDSDVTAAIAAEVTRSDAKAKELAEAGAESAATALAMAKSEIEEDIREVVDDLADYIESNNTVLAGVKATADTAATKTDVETALNLKADKTALAKTEATLTEVKTTVDNFFSEDAVIEGAIDTIKEIANYIATDKTRATEIITRVSSLETNLSTESTTRKAKDEILETAITVEKTRAETAELGLSDRISEIESLLPKENSPDVGPDSLPDTLPDSSSKVLATEEYVNTSIKNTFSYDEETATLIISC